MINPTAHRLTFMAVEKMELYKFLLNILASSPEHYDVAFKIGLLSLELPRAPASIKPLEVGRCLIFRINIPTCHYNTYKSSCHQ